jgi:predicted oxidoreductase
VIKGDTIEALAAGLRERLAKLADATGGVQLDPAFAENVHTSIARFNDLARRGVDVDFHRGELAISRHMHGPRAADNDLPSKTMFPLSAEGPYYATILAPGAIETKGGPRVDSRMRVIGPKGTPLPGLYGVGNCVASPSGQAYWSAGSTFGPYVAFGYVAARSLAAEPARGEPVRSALGA